MLERALSFYRAAEELSGSYAFQQIIDWRGRVIRAVMSIDLRASGGRATAAWPRAHFREYRLDVSARRDELF